MKKKTVFYLWITIIVFILILIPYIQNAGSGPGGAAGAYFFFTYSESIAGIYLYIISLGMLGGVLITLFIQSLLKDLKEKEPTKFDLNT